MRDYGKIFTTLWSSETFRSMTEDGRSLTLYLLSSPHGTIAGVFRLPDGYVCEDMQWTAERVAKGFAELFQKGFANRCETTKWVWVCKHLEWNPPENPNQRKAAKKIAEQVPCECGWKQEFMRVCGVSIGFDPPAIQEPLPNPSETVSEPGTGTGTGTGTGVKPPTAKRSTPPSKRKIPLPEGFGISAAVMAWASEKGFGQLEAHLDAFTRKATAKGYTYVDWDAAFMEAIREDWAKLRGRAANGAAPPPDSTVKAGNDAAEATRREQEARARGAAPPPAHIREQLASLTKKFTGAMA